jgi:hypothetical protein
LERSLKKPRKSAAKSKARALTVMRFEGASAARAATHVPARLSSDLEEQIAVVRGRAIAKPSRGLLQLEERLLGAQEAEPAAPAIRRFDHGAPPPPGPSKPVFAPPPSSPPVAQASALSAAPPLAGSAFSGRFNVESFEETPTAPPVLMPRTDATTGMPPTTPAVPWEEPRVAPPQGTWPWASEQSARRVNKRALSREQQAVAAEFERDVAAMLGSATPPAAAPEDKQWEDTLRHVGGATAAAPAATTPAAAVPDAPPAPRTNAHEVFNQMGLAMNYANSFDLGAVDLSARFDRFDAELALESKPPPAAAPPVPVQALALDDFDVVADLAELSGAQAAPSEKQSEPAEPGTTP